MKETTMTKAERGAQNLMISWAIQDVINAKAIFISEEQIKEANLIIAKIASDAFKPAEA